MRSPQATTSAPARYHSRFGAWYERATVRTGQRRVLAAETGDCVFFPPELLPIATHPLVAGLGPAAARDIGVRRLHDYLQFTVELEATTVVPVASAIARGRSGLELPAQMCADAFKIATDEAWHAQFSYDLMAQLAEATSIEPRGAADPAFMVRLARIREQVPADLLPACELLVAVVSETLISRILSDLPHERRLPRAVREVVADHAYDEGKHHAYFRSLLQFLWPVLDGDQRRRLGPLLPGLIAAFLEPDYQAQGQALRAAGLSAAQAEQVLAECYPRQQVTQTVASAARSTVDYFAEAGALDDGGTRDSFAEAGLLAHA